VQVKCDQHAVSSVLPFWASKLTWKFILVRHLPLELCKLLFLLFATWMYFCPVHRFMQIQVEHKVCNLAVLRASIHLLIRGNSTINDTPLLMDLLRQSYHLFICLYNACQYKVIEGKCFQKIFLYFVWQQYLEFELKRFRKFSNNCMEWHIQERSWSIGCNCVELVNNVLLFLFDIPLSTWNILGHRVYFLFVNYPCHLL